MNTQETQTVQHNPQPIPIWEQQPHIIQLKLDSNDTNLTHSDQHQSSQDQPNNSTPNISQYTPERNSTLPKVQKQQSYSSLTQLLPNEPIQQCSIQQFTVTDKSQFQIQPVVLQEQQDDDELIETIFKNTEESKEIVALAFNQRKQANKINYNAYIEKKEQYYQEFNNNLLKIEAQAEQNLIQSELVGKQIIKFMKDLKQAYHNFHKDLNKITFKPTSSLKTELWSKIIPEPFYSLLQFKESTADSTKIFYEWLDSESIPQLDQMFKTGKDKLEHLSRETKKIGELYKKQNLKIFEGDKPFDMLMEELRLTRMSEEESKRLNGWGNASAKLLETMAETNSTILSTLKQSVLKTVEHLKNINKESHHLYSTERFINKLSPNPPSQLSRIISQTPFQQAIYLKYLPTQPLNPTNIYHYLSLTKSSSNYFGNITQILHQLYINIYKVMSDFNKGNWKAAEVFFSIENNLIVTDQFSKVRGCYKIGEVKCEVNGFDVKIREEKENIFGVVERREKMRLKFNCGNQIEEFMSLLEFMKSLRGGQGR